MPHRYISDLPITERDLVFFDTETTGLDYDSELVEIGLVKARRQSFEILAEVDIKILPAHLDRADPESLEIINYNQDEWSAEGMSLKNGLEKFLTYTNEAILVGHNLLFDYLKIEQSLWQCQLKGNYFYKGLDTFCLGWFLLEGRPEFKTISLRELAEFFKIDRGQAHRAIDDARTTYQVFMKLMNYNK